ncbi:MAG: type IV pilin [Acidilobaceae archaeon]|nr:type IV pilin [Acidilobaceae archaeon]
MRRAISPVIATVILIAITIVIGAAVGGWLLGLWGGFGDVEAIRIYPDAKLQMFQQNNKTRANLTLTLKNEGTRDAIIRKITVEGVGECLAGNITLLPPTPTPTSTPFSIPFSLEAGQTKSIRCTMDGSKVTAGGSYVVKVMTESGGVYQITVTARS